MIVMQMSFQLLKSATRLIRACCAAGPFALGFMAELRADPFSTEWIVGKKSAARLIAAPDQEKGAYRAGVQIRLDPGALTYWRFPGEVGAPPEFSFEGSENLKDVIVYYPTPMRFGDPGLEEFGYRGAVTFPIDVKLADANRPGVLTLSLKYAVCGGICLPTSVETKLVLPVKSVDHAETAVTDVEAVITAAKASVPQRLSAAERDAKVAIVRDSAAGKPTWRVKLRETPQTDGEKPNGDDGVTADIFVESTGGYYFESKKGDRPNEFLIVEVEAPDKAPTAGEPAAEGGEIPISITLAHPRQSYEFAAALDATPAPSTTPQAAYAEEDDAKKTIEGKRQ
jgi:DsbC/DsbD-like thiol-disulfide interchange protein